MAKDYDFLPDEESSGNFDKLLPSQSQRFGFVRWTLFGVLTLLVLLVQDSLVYLVDFFGAGADLVPCVIIMIAALQGAESASIFSLVAALLFYFSGSAPGPYVVAFIPTLAIFVAIFRQARLRQGFFSILLATALGMLIYELLLFGWGLFWKLTTVERFSGMMLTALLSLVSLPVTYPIARAISKIGGEPWKE